MRIAALGVGGVLMGTQHRSINSTFGRFCLHVDGRPTSDRGVAELGGWSLKPTTLGGPAMLQREHMLDGKHSGFFCKFLKMAP